MTDKKSAIIIASIFNSLAFLFACFHQYMRADIKAN